MFLVRPPLPPKSSPKTSQGIDDYRVAHDDAAVRGLFARPIAYQPQRKAEFNGCVAWTTDLFADPPPPPEFIVADLIPNECGTLNATGGTGKTTIALWLAARIALGLEFLGRPVLRPGGVLYITGEDKRADLGHRLVEIARGMNLTGDDYKRLARSFYVEDVSERLSPRRAHHKAMYPT